MTNDDRFVIYKMFTCIMRALIILILHPNADEHVKLDLRTDYRHFCKSLDESWGSTILVTRSWPSYG